MAKKVSVNFQICEQVKSDHTLSERSALFPSLIIKFAFKFRQQTAAQSDSFLHVEAFSTLLSPPGSFTPVNVAVRICACKWARGCLQQYRALTSVPKLWELDTQYQFCGACINYQSAAVVSDHVPYKISIYSQAPNFSYIITYTYAIGTSHCQARKTLQISAFMYKKAGQEFSQTLLSQF